LPPYRPNNRSTPKKKPNECIQYSFDTSGAIQYEWNLYTAYEALHKGYKLPRLKIISLDLSNDCLGCTASCLVKTAIGEIGTKTLQYLGMAIARRLAWETGKQVIPVAGTISTVISGLQAIICFVKCN